MSAPVDKSPRPSRRGLLTAAGGFVAAAGIGKPAEAANLPVMPDTEAFHGPHQAGIVTPQQSHCYFAVLDLTTEKRSDVINLLQAWTNAAERLTVGRPGASIEADPRVVASDSAEVLGLPASRLTLTFGFGPGLFTKNSIDRYGLAFHRPGALVDLPRFNGDQLIPEKTGGDLSIQACANDPLVAFHAVRQLARLSYDAAEFRWAQAGFLSRPADGSTPRNLMGFKDGTQRPNDIDRTVWVGADGPAWMLGGSYLVVRRIRMALEHWDQMKLAFQEQTMGRHKYSGAPLGLRHEFQPLGLDRNDAGESPVIGDTAHVRLGNAAENGATEMLRRGYSYNDGVSFTAERWPPWRQGTEYDTGLLFLCYQVDPRPSFIRLFEKMSKLDMLNQFVTHTGGGLFACPGGVQPGQYIGQHLFDAA